jgi:hypothetical protein
LCTEIYSDKFDTEEEKSPPKKVLSESEGESEKYFNSDFESASESELPPTLRKEMAANHIFKQFYDNDFCVLFFNLSVLFESEESEKVASEDEKPTKRSKASYSTSKSTKKRNISPDQSSQSDSGSESEEEVERDKRSKKSSKYKHKKQHDLQHHHHHNCDCMPPHTFVMPPISISRFAILYCFHFFDLSYPSLSQHQY